MEVSAFHKGHGTHHTLINDSLYPPIYLILFHEMIHLGSLGSVAVGRELQKEEPGQKSMKTASNNLGKNFQASDFVEDINH